MNAAMERPMRSTSIQSVFRAVCRAAGSPVDSFRTGDGIHIAFEADRLLRAAGGGGGGFSTVSLPGILGNVANKAMLAAYNAVGAAWRSIAAVRSNVDFKAHTRYRMTGQGAFQKVGADGELKHFTVDEQGYQSQLDTYGSTIALTRQMIVNDDLSAFLGLPRIIGRQAGIAVDKAVFTLLLSNPGSFFAAGNNNYIEGATTPLGIASLTTLETLFLKQVDTNGDPVLIVPRTLLVPPELAAYAAQLVRSSETRDNEADKLYPTGNPHAGRFTPVSSPWLSTSSITGNSAVAWYLFGEPGDVAAIAVAFLNGRDMPIIESGDTSFDTLGVAWRGYFDFGVAMEDHRAAAKSKGAA